MKTTEVNNYIIDVLGYEESELEWNDLTEEQKEECRDYNG